MYTLTSPNAFSPPLCLFLSLRPYLPTYLPTYIFPTLYYTAKSNI